MTHIPVLLKETVDALDIQPDDSVLDGTVGNGGHSQEIAKKLSPKGMIIGIDEDGHALAMARLNLERFSCRIELVQENFRNLDQVLIALEHDSVNKILLDLGLRSEQLDESGRGFTFRKNEPLLMTFRDDPGEERVTAYDVVNTWGEESLADIIYGFGEERYSRKIAHALVKAREKKPLETTGELVHLIESVVPSRYIHGPTHPATRTFQAIRMAVNDEVNVLHEGLLKAWKYLAPQGRLAIISFHSIEDRIVKQFFKEQKDGIRIFKKPIAPTEEEIKKNPRSRSAKLRVLQKS